jgi:uncharacterized phiE125 gp8 family phage protein
MVDGVNQDDTVVENLIDEVTDYLEHATNRYILSQSVTVYLDAGEITETIHLPCVPLVSVTSITTTDDDGDDTVVDSSNYQVRVGEDPRITLTQSGSWPTDVRAYDGMAIVCAVGSNGSVVPEVGFVPTSTTATQLDDMVAGGTFTGTVKTKFEIVIDGADTDPETVKWRKITRDADGVKTFGAWTEGVDITGAAQTLGDGTTVTFTNTTGHTASSQWNVQLVERIPRRIRLLFQGLIVHFYSTKGRGVDQTASGQLIGLPNHLRNMIRSLRVQPWA